MSTLRIHVKKLFRLDTRLTGLFRRARELLTVGAADVRLCVQLNTGTVVRYPLTGKIGHTEQSGYYHVDLPLPDGVCITAVWIDGADGNAVCQYELEVIKS